MIFSQPLQAGRLLRRYKRFLADVELESGEVITAHCPNTGAMLGCDHPGARVWLSTSDNPKRRCRHTWEMVETRTGVIVGIHTGRSNAIVLEALNSGLLPELGPWDNIRREVAVKDLGARVDFKLESDDRPALFLEVKNVTAAVSDGIALFPDAVSERAVRHLRTLVTLVERGFDAALCYCVQRDDVCMVRPAVEIHPEYATALAQACAAGVLVTAVGCCVSPASIVPQGRVGVEVDVV
jgi:sugar fermentation stimulation protein A